MKMKIEMAKNLIQKTQSKQKPPPQSDQYIPKEFKDIAKGMEKQFAQFLINKMQDTVIKSSKQNSAKDYYDSLINEERAEIMTQNNGGLGLQTMILDQLYPQKFRTKEAYQLYLNHQNKGKIAQKDSVTLDPSKKPQKIQIKEENSP
jgi:Rod binding domain-containing protein